MNRTLVVYHANSNTGMSYRAHLRTMQQQNVVGQQFMTQTFMLMDDAKGAPVPDVTLTDAGDLVVLATHGLSNGQKLIFTVITSTTGIAVDTIYYVVNKNTDDFQVAATSGGTPLTLTTNGKGTYYTEAEPTHWYWWEIGRTYNAHIKNTWSGVPANPQVGQTFLCTDCECGGTTLTYPLTFDGTSWRCGNGNATPNTP